MAPPMAWAMCASVNASWRASTLLVRPRSRMRGAGFPQRRKPHRARRTGWQRVDEAEEVVEGLPAFLGRRLQPQDGVADDRVRVVRVLKQSDQQPAQAWRRTASRSHFGEQRT